jgi:LPXTG-motif cell wall-anchored protein
VDSFEPVDASRSDLIGRLTRRRVVHRALVAGALASLGVITLGAGPASAHFCEPLTPSANPSATETSAATDVTVDSDGTYRVDGLLFSDTTPIALPDGGFYWPTTTIEYIEWDGPDVVVTPITDGTDGASAYRIQAPGDLFVHAPKGSDDAVVCGVPQVQTVTVVPTASPTTAVPAPAPTAVLATTATPMTEESAASPGEVLSVTETSSSAQVAPAASGQLPATGANTRELLFVGLALVGLGCVALMFTSSGRTTSV